MWGWVCAITLMETSVGSDAEKIVSNTLTPNTRPRLVKVVKTPDATPCSCTGASLIAWLLFGKMNIPYESANHMRKIRPNMSPWYCEAMENVNMQRLPDDVAEFSGDKHRIGLDQEVAQHHPGDVARSNVEIPGNSGQRNVHDGGVKL